MSININLSGTITVIDSATGLTNLTKSVSAAMIIGSSFTQMQNLNIGTAVTNLSLPVTPVQFVYLKNLHVNQTVAVTWTTPAGGSVSVITLEPGAVIIFTESAPGAGITAISLQASGATTPVEYILGG